MANALSLVYLLTSVPRSLPQLDNILLHGDAPAVLKLCDFGYSKDGSIESDCKTACGTPEYMAPEVRCETVTPRLHVVPAAGRLPASLSH